MKISYWNPETAGWDELQMLIDLLDQRAWVAFSADWHRSSHILVAHEGKTPLGFLRYVLQPIGVEQDWEPFTLHGQELIEAKVLAFGVTPAFRHQGIGRALQERLIVDSKVARCYQIRSHSSASNVANYALKLSLGFGVHALNMSSEREGVYFVLPLRVATEE